MPIFQVERRGKRVFVVALFNCGRYLILVYEDGERVSPEKYDWIIPEVRGYLRVFTDTPIEFVY